MYAHIYTIYKVTGFNQATRTTVYILTIIIVTVWLCYSKYGSHCQNAMWPYGFNIPCIYIYNNIQPTATLTYLLLPNICQKPISPPTWDITAKYLMCIYVACMITYVPHLNHVGIQNCPVQSGMDT